MFDNSVIPSRNVGCSVVIIDEVLEALDANSASRISHVGTNGASDF